METGAWSPSSSRRLPWIRREVLFVGLVVVVVVVVRGNRVTSSTQHHVTSGSEAVTPVCPGGCFCSALSRIVYCSRRGLTELPAGIPADSLHLNVNGNRFRIPFLHRSNFSHLPVLEHLYLSECGVEGLDHGTFLDLPRLRWLDLSNNRIRALTPRSFQGLHLLHLFLNGNRNLVLDPDSFTGLVTVGLYLHDCHLTWIDPKVLVPLVGSLKYLWLNGNELGTLDVRLDDIFRTLAHLRLGSNPLHCNCRLAWIKSLFDSSADVFKGAVFPSCMGPSRIRGRFLSELSGSDFRCETPTFRNIDAVFGGAGEGRLDCRASGDPAPDLYWIKPSGWTVRYMADQQEGHHDPPRGSNEATLWVSRVDTDPNLVGMYICVATNEAGNVTLTINVSWPVHLDTTPTTTTTTADLYSATKRPELTKTTESMVGMKGRKENEQELHQDDGFRTTRPNYTLIRSPGHHPHLQNEAQMFSVLQMAFAVIGSHVFTLVLCLATVPFCYQSRWTRLKSRSSAPLGHGVKAQRGTPGGGGGFPGTDKLPVPNPQPEVTIPDSPSVTNTGCSQFYLPDYFITSSSQ